MTQASASWNVAGTYSWPAPQGLTSVDEADVYGSGAGGGAGDGGTSAVVTYNCKHTRSFYGTHVGGSQRNVDDLCYQGAYSGGYGSVGSQFFFATFDAAAMQDDLTGATVSQVELWANNQHSWFNSGADLYVGWSTRTDLATGGSITSFASNDNPRAVDQIFFAEGVAQWTTLTGSGGGGPAFINHFLVDSATALVFGDDTTQDLGHYGYWAGGPGNIKLRVTFTSPLVAGGGGGGGGLGKKTNIPVTGLTSYTIVVGAGGLGSISGDDAAEDGNDSSFSGDSVVTTGHKGLAGDDGDSSGPTEGSGGAAGASDGSGAAGEAGGGGVTAHGGSGGAAATGGGAHQAGNTVAGDDGFDGNGPGGGGTGSLGSGGDGGAGADGSVTITWTIPNLSISSSDTGSASDAAGPAAGSPHTAETASGIEGVPKVGVNDK